MSSFPPVMSMLIWGLLATVAMTSILQASQGLGLSRLSLPLLVGTLFTGSRRAAVLVGFLAYVTGGWIFSLLYFWLFASLGTYTWWIGAGAGAVHGLVLLTAVLPVLPYVHPRMASDYDGPVDTPQLEPPGFLGLNYGPQTPLTTMAGQVVFGAVLGGLPQFSGFVP